ncbi:MAG: hypothetical protein ACTJHT_02160 [Sphingobacterium sp.]|uniref:hypothetical protein n=1 Tax=Sphingobacterium sp. JB170 TaxID=1434842 RepID=UPI00097F55B7|nr:hypothetical protein [Sphingobacterium sp. JB170]SJN39827.1 hypothetical protein FM107_10310 [Sphingobacterium sp. JB170]
MKRDLVSAIIVLLSLGVLSSCGNSGKNEDGSSKHDVKIGQYHIPSASENPSFYLSLVKSRQTDSTVVFVAKSLREADTIGVQIEILKNMPAGITPDGMPDEDNGFTEGAIKFTSIGTNSDELVAAMAHVFKLPEEKGMTTATLAPLAFSSNKKDADLTKNGTYTFKLFFENQIGPEAEAFVVFDTYKRLFEFRAKDSTQYKPLVSAFQGQ